MTAFRSRKNSAHRLLLALGAAVFFASSAHALRFEPSDELSIDLDTTLAYGAMWRVEEQEKSRIDKDEATLRDPTFNIDDRRFQDYVTRWNSDDGNRNFEKGDLVSNRTAVTSDFDMRHGDYGLFLRGQVFYDSVYFEETSWDGEGWDDWLGFADTDCDFDGVPDEVNDGVNPVCAPGNSYTFNGLGAYAGPESINNAMASGAISDPSHFSDDDKERHGYDARFLDAFVYGSFPIGNRTLDLRLGRQAISWGEALMLQGGIGFAQNRIDAAAATSPGVELKEIFLPTGSLYGQVDLTEALTLEAYWQYEWKPSELFSSGAYFSSIDMLESDVLLVNARFQALCMFGLEEYYGNGADRDGSPIDPLNPPATRCDSNPQVGPYYNLIGYGTEHWLLADPSAMRKAEDAEPDHQSDQYGVALRMLMEGGSEAGVYFVQYHDKYPSLWAANNGAKDIGYYAQNALIDPTWVGAPQDSSTISGFNSQRYTIEYKERIKLYGLTYNTVINDIQMGFELTYRENQPVVPSCTAEMLDPANISFADTSNPAPNDFYGQFKKGTSLQSSCKDESAKWYAGYVYKFATNDWGSPPGSIANKLLGWPAEAEVMTYNVGVTLVVPPTPLWDTGIFVGELGGWYVGGFENEDLKVTEIGGFTKKGNGVSAIFLPQYKNVIEGVDLTIPFFVNYTIDGSFSYYAYNEKALWASVGVEAVYLSNLRVGLVYSAFGGANSMWRDRDNIAFNVKYTF